MAMNQLDALKQFTTVVADTGDFRQLSAFRRRMRPPTRRSSSRRCKKPSTRR